MHFRLNIYRKLNVRSLYSVSEQPATIAHIPNLTPATSPSPIKLHIETPYANKNPKPTKFPAANTAGAILRSDTSTTVNTITMASGINKPQKPPPLRTILLPIDVSCLPPLETLSPSQLSQGSCPNTSTLNLFKAAQALRTGPHPIAFPTETVYGLGADATNTDAVRNIFAAKNRPADNPLIVHFDSVEHLRGFLLQNNNHSGSNEETANPTHTNGEDKQHSDPIPAVYRLLIQKFWPGPLSILLPLPQHSRLSPLVTGPHATFAARIPNHPLALALIRATGRPLAAPSANTSGRPSPTAADHVVEDLAGRIAHVLDDGGVCSVGVESTVVDGLAEGGPVVLRLGGVGVDELRAVGGAWARVRCAEGAGEGAPRAPGMKYRHYAPRARVVVFEEGREVRWADLEEWEGKGVGFVRAGRWKDGAMVFAESSHLPMQGNGRRPTDAKVNGHATSIPNPNSLIPTARRSILTDPNTGINYEAWVIDLGGKVEDIARGLFASLRILDRKGVGVIFIEGIDDSKGNLAAAVMERARKAVGDVRP